MKSLMIRADANAQIGTGHLMRCLALAQVWQDQGGEAIFITACDSRGLLQRLCEEGFQVIELEETYPDPLEWEAVSQILAVHNGSWVVMDGYHFDPAYQRRIKDAGHSLLVIDDMAHLDHYYADVVLNQNIHAKELDYSCEPDTRLLLGTEYVLLRREFWSWRNWEREIPNVARKILVTLGGSDTDNQTLKIIRVLNQMNVDKIEATIVIGASNQHFEEIKFAISQSSHNIHLVRNISNMPEMMAWADIAISAGGSTSWEIAFMGLPSVVLILADNQREIAKKLDDYGAAINLGVYKGVSKSSLTQGLKEVIFRPECRKKMSKRGRTLVDGMGVKRVATSLGLHYEK